MISGYSTRIFDGDISYGYHRGAKTALGLAVPVTQDNPAPYAPTSVILSLLERHRQKGLPTPVTADVLSRAGVTESLNSRTLQALQVLDLIDQDGRPTPILEGLRLAPETEYKARMGEWLKGAYADALKFIDPEVATETQVHDAFRSYKPPGMRDRMVTLFLGLFEAAGIAPERKKRASLKAANRSVPRVARQQRSVSPSPVPQSVSQPNPASPPRYDHRVTGLHPAIAGLLSSLPPDGETWDRHERDRFLHTFEAVIDFCYPVMPGKVQKTVTQQKDEDDDR